MSSVWTAKYRDEDGREIRRSTGCRDKQAAQVVLNDWLRQVELIKSGVFTKAEAEISDHQAIALIDHIDQYIDYLTRRGKSVDRVTSTYSRLLEGVTACRWSKLAELSADGLQRYLDEKQIGGMSAGSLNGRLECWVAFGYWLAGKRMNGKRPAWIGDRRLTKNPFDGFPRYDNRSDCRRRRRAMTEAELVRLIHAVRRRPLQEALTVRTGRRKGELVANVRDSVRRRLELLGWERALIYKTLVLTGLRRNELASITVERVCLDAKLPFIDLLAGDEKNGDGSEIPLRNDLAADLRKWVKQKLESLQMECRRRGEAIPSKLPEHTPLFNVPKGLVRILDRDLVAAGIAKRVKVNGKWRIDKRDGRGRTIDVHALRHSFGTLLSKGGVPPRTAQAAMRHSSVDLTMNVYTDPALLDVHGALETLPGLDLTDTGANRHAATGTDGQDANRKWAPKRAPTIGNLSHSGASGDVEGVSASSSSQLRKPRETKRFPRFF